MPNCKICGQPVRTAKVFHTACWETAANEAAEQFCDEYCRFNRMGMNEVELTERHCDSCALIEVVP